MKTTKKLLSILLSALMVLSLVAAAFAEGSNVIGSGQCGAQGNNLTWTLTDDGVLTISGTGAMADYGTSYQLDENHERIYDNEANQYLMLENGTPPWMDCNEYGDLLAQLGYASEADAEAAVANGTFDWDAYYNLVIASNVPIGTHKVVIGEGVTTIGANAFKEWNVSEVVLPSTLKEIGYYAFEGNHFTTVALPEGLEYIGEYALEWCNEMESIVIPASVTHMDSYAVGGYKLKDVTVLNPTLDIYDIGYICVLGAKGESFPFESEQDYEFFSNVRDIVTLYGYAAYEFPTFLASTTTYYNQLVQNGQMTQAECDNYLAAYRIQYIGELKVMLGDGTINDFNDAVAVACAQLNALFGTNYPEADLAGVYTETDPDDPSISRTVVKLAPAADALLTQRVGHGYVELCEAEVREHSIAHYANNYPNSDYVPAPWVTLKGICGSAFETYVQDVFPFTKLHDFTNVAYTTAPTCVAAGVKTFYCQNCLAQITKGYPALGHDIIEHAAKAPTATEVGWNAYQTCSRCDYSTYEELPATGSTDTPSQPGNPGGNQGGSNAGTSVLAKIASFFQKIVAFFKNLFRK